MSGQDIIDGTRKNEYELTLMLANCRKFPRRLQGRGKNDYPGIFFDKNENIHPWPWPLGTTFLTDDRAAPTSIFWFS